MDAARRSWRLALALSAALLPGPMRAWGEETRSQKLLTGLNQPTGVAIRQGSLPAAHTQPRQSSGSYDVVICDSGAGRIVAVRSDQPDKPVELVTGFPPLPEAKDGATIDPKAVSGLFFLDYHRLVVGSANPGKPSLRLYDIGGKALPIPADSPAQEVPLPKRGDSSRSRTSIAGYSLARTLANDHVADLLIVSSPRAEDRSGLWKVLIRADTLEKAGLLELAEGNSSAAFHAVTVSPNGFVVAIEASEDKEQRHLVFLNPIDATIVARLPLDLANIVALSYSPRTENLYAAAFGESTEYAGGIYRLDAAGPSGEVAITAVRVAGIDRPSAMCFGLDGVLYVTDQGDGPARKRESGTLLKLTGEL